jgi:hypothetical protein
VDLSLLWLDTGRIAPAQQTLSRFAEAMRNAEPDVWSGAWAEAALGRCLSLQGKQQQAQALLSSGRRRLGALLGEGHEVVLQVDGWAVENSSSSQ